MAGSKITKAFVIGALATVSLGLTAPTSSASHEKSWSEGCRGYWYSTSGHAYCTKATNWPSYNYWTRYDCKTQVDKERYDELSKNYRGKFDEYECIVKINKTKVWRA
ncbi:hypothetical protein [Streptomyces sp. NPDC005438]|uniref:hypothetical protein n=1 Tax=Streptomyces sp. NPDC005438 TaxID=3156880 RepID=UPI0033A1DBBC